MKEQIIELAKAISKDESFKSVGEKLMALALGMAKIATINSGVDWDTLKQEEKEQLTMMMFTNVFDDELKSYVINS